MTPDYDASGSIEWIELQPVAAGDTSLGTLTRAALAVLPFAHDTHVMSPHTGQRLAVPYGNLIAYAEYLTQNTDDPPERFILHFHFFPDDDAHAYFTVPPTAVEFPRKGLAGVQPLDPHAPIEAGQLVDLNDPEVQRAITEGRIQLMA